MICQECQLGGEATTVANREKDRPDIRNALISKAMDHHQKCRNSQVKKPDKNTPKSDKSRLTTWCDCQHSTGVFLNAALLRSENEGNTNAVAE